MEEGQEEREEEGIGRGRDAVPSHSVPPSALASAGGGGPFEPHLSLVFDASTFSPDAVLPAQQTAR